MKGIKKNLDIIHIVGKGASWGNAPSVWSREHPDTEEVWGLNNMFLNHKNLDRLFLMHDPRQELIFEDRDFFVKARELTIPIYTATKYSVLGDNNEVYPTEEVINAYPIVYYTNVVCWMLALAILLDPKKIIYHGIDMAIAVEYDNERGAVEFWTGVAIGRGITVDIPQTSKVCTTESKWGVMYGYIAMVAKNGLIRDWEPDYRGFNKPDILERYELVPRTESITLGDAVQVIERR